MAVERRATPIYGQTQVEFRSIPWDQGLPEQNLDTLASVYGVGQDVIELLKPDNFPVIGTGDAALDGPLEESFGIRVPNEIKYTLRSCDILWRGERVFGAAIVSGQSARTQRRAVSRHDTRDSANVNWDRADMQIIAADYISPARKGLGSNSAAAAGIALEAAVLSYYAVALDPTLQENAVESPLRAVLRGSLDDFEVEDWVATESRRLLHSGITDLSAFGLDQRLSRVTALTSFGAAGLALNYLTAIKTLSRVADRDALRLAHDYRNNMFDTGFSAKLQLLDQIAGVAQLAAQKEAHPLARQTFAAMSSLAAGDVQQILLAQKFMARVYESQGFAVPAFLDLPAQQETQATAEVSGKARHAESAILRPAKAPEPIDLEAVRRQITEAADATAALHKAWRLSNKERESRGFGELIKRLGRGAARRVGADRFEPLQTGAQVKEAVDVMVTLDSLAGMLSADALQHVQEGLGLEDRVSSMENTVKRNKNLLGPDAPAETAPVTEVVQLKDTLEWMWRNRGALRNIVAGAWPNPNRLPEQQGPLVAARIGQMLSLVFDAYHPPIDVSDKLL
jgi:hypothetical protein